MSLRLFLFLCPYLFLFTVLFPSNETLKPSSLLFLLFCLLLCLFQFLSLFLSLLSLLFFSLIFKALFPSQ
jgi:hypothetical protein